MGDLILFVLLLIGVLDGWRHGVIKLLGNIGGVLVGIMVPTWYTTNFLRWIPGAWPF